MDKEYMLTQIRSRVTELKRAIQNTISFKDEYGKPLSKGSAQYYRQRYTRDLRILQLMELLLLTSEVVWIDDEEDIKVFDNLTNPRRLK